MRVFKPTRKAENGKTVKYLFNYKRYLQAQNERDYAQNIQLKTGDTVIVP